MRHYDLIHAAPEERANRKRRRRSDDVETMGQEESDRFLMNLIVKNALPSTILSEENFRQFIAMLPRSYSLRSCQTFTISLGSYFDECKTNWKCSLSQVRHLSLCADLWSCRRRSFFCVTAHYIDRKSKMSSSVQRICLCFSRIRGSHTAETIRNLTTKVNLEYGIEQKITALITDNGSNIVAALESSI